MEHLCSTPLFETEVPEFEHITDFAQMSEEQATQQVRAVYESFMSTALQVAIEQSEDNCSTSHHDHASKSHHNASMQWCGWVAAHTLPGRLRRFQRDLLPYGGRAHRSRARGRCALS